MTEIIEKWLLNCAGVNIVATPQMLGQLFFDGTLYGKILLEYNICSDDYIKIIPKTDRCDVAYANLKKLCIWFKLLGIAYNDEFLREISRKNGSAVLRLLYELFIRLENKEIMRNINAQKKERLLTESTDKFKVEPALLTMRGADVSDDMAYLYKGLRQGEKIIQRYVNKESNLVINNLVKAKKRKRLLNAKLCNKTGDESRNEYKNKEFVSKDDREFFNLIAKFEDYQKNPERKEEARFTVDCQPKAFVSLLKVARRKGEADKSLKEKMQTDILDDVWRQVLTEREEVSRDILAKKLLKQSEYEKQMSMRLRRSRLRYYKFMDNRSMMLRNEESDKQISEFKESYRTTREDEARKCEWERIRKLHKKLYEEKRKIKYEREYQACWSIVEDIISYAVMFQEFKNEFKQEPPKSKIAEWKLKFMRGMDLLCGTVRMEDLLRSTIPIENECTEAISEHEFHKYLSLLEQWNPNNFKELVDVSPERMNVVGYMVNRLLDMKYKFEMSFGKPADVNHYQVQVLLKPANNIFVMESLRKLLMKSGIAVIDICTAVNYAINSYSIYIRRSETKKDILNVRMTAKYSSRHTPTTQSRVEKKEGFKDRMMSKPLVTEVMHQDKYTQFPSYHDLPTDTPPSQRMPKLAQLGKVADCYLAEGLPLSDVLLCQIIIEYVKSLKSIKGWVLINFPRDLTQVAILEYMFTGKEVPFIKDVTDNIWVKLKNELECANDDLEEEERPKSSVEFEEIVAQKHETSHTVKEVNETPIINVQSSKISVFSDIRDHPTMGDIIFHKTSKILPKPNRDSPIPHFKSIFTKFIKLNGPACSGESSSLETKTADMSASEMNQEQMEEEIVTGGKVDKRLYSETIEDFYFSLEIGTIFDYNDLNTDVMMQLGRIILNEPQNESDFGWKDAIDLFGFNTFAQRRPKELKNHMTSLKKPVVTKNSLLEGQEVKRSSIEDITKMLYLEENEEESENLNSTSMEFEERDDIYPGHPQWMYSEPQISKKYYDPLTSIWETVEFYYKFNLEEIFNFLHLADSKLLPYRNFLLDKAKLCVLLCDDRNIIATNFQVMLNSINENLRPVKTVKTELLCRAFELQCSLWKMADAKKILSEVTLRDIKKEKWLPRRLCNYLKAYTCMFQVEADRFVDTMQLITDYHSICLLKQPSSERLTKIVIPKCEWGKEVTNDSVGSTNHSSKSQKLSRRVKQDTITTKNQKAPRSMDESFIYNCCEIMEDDTSAVLELLQEIGENLQNKINNIQEICKGIHEECMNSFSRETKVRGSSSVPKKSIETEQLLAEWESAIEDETDRVLFRTKLILARGQQSIQEQIYLIDEAFNHFQDYIVQQYHTELNNIDKFCDLVKVAIEEEVKIQPSIVLELDRFYVDPDVVMYPCPPPPPPTRIQEIPIGYQFTINQLNNFINKMSLVSPLGIIKQSFIYILQDMAYIGHEMGHPFLPPVWSSFSTTKITKLIDRWFGNKSVINWKEFIVFGLGLNYPTLQDILKMKQQFEKIDQELLERLTSEQFLKTSLWFENMELMGVKETLREAKAKELLFKLFQVDKKYMNYSCFLLSFCKDENPTEGFLKALAVVDGCLTIAWESDFYLEENQMESENEKYVIAKSILQEMLDCVFRIYDIRVESYYEESNLLEVLTEENVETIDQSKTLINGGITDQSDKESSSSSSGETQISINSEKSKDDNQLIWKSVVRFDSVLSIFVFSLQYYSTFLVDAYEQVALQKNLNKIFSEKGNGHTIKLVTLLNDDYIKNLISSYRLFQAINISKCLSQIDKTIPSIKNEYLLQNNI